MKRKIEQLPANQPLKSQHRIMDQVYAKLLKILKEFEGPNNPKDRLARVHVCVVGGSVDGAPGGVPVHPEVLQEGRKPVIIEEVVRRVVCKLAISYTEFSRKLTTPGGRFSGLPSGPVLMEDWVCALDFRIGGAGVVCGVAATAALEKA